MIATGQSGQDYRNERAVSKHSLLIETNDVVASDHHFPS